MLKLFLILATVFVLASGTPAALRNGQPRRVIEDEEEMRREIDNYNKEAAVLCNKNSKASWDVETDKNNAEKEMIYKKVSAEYALFRKTKWEELWKEAIIENFQEESVRRQLKLLKELGTAALEETEYAELISTTSKMSQIYSSATICPYKKPNCSDTDRLKLNPDMEAILAKSNDYDELAYIWKEWRDQTGKKMREDYKTYVTLMNSAAVANDLEDASKLWQARYEDDDFETKIDALWDQVKPLYDQLHTYVRYKLIEIHGNKIDYNDPNIPAHLLGNMWAQSWTSLYERTKPFKDASLVDVTSKLISGNYSVERMFELSNEFYKSMGLKPNDMSFDPNLAVIVQPPDRVITCHASAWDFCDGEDFRIKMCTEVNMTDFITIHHEMGHIQYYLQYKDQPLTLRGGANPGFHEAVGDTIALSVATPQHLQKIGLLDEYADSEEDNINALYSMALERIAFLPFGLLIDKWRWEVFNGKVSQDKWNERWWELRKKYQKVTAPFERTENDFDPGAKYHVAANSQYIAYFVAHVLEFQMYKSLCIAAKKYDEANPNKNQLHKCDFFNSIEAGNKLSQGLRLGTSKKWSEALELITGSSELEAKAITEYFEPLMQFLKKENEKLKDEHELRLILDTYNKDASRECTLLVTAEWDSITNVDDKDKQKAYADAVEANAKFVKDQFNKHFKDLNYTDYQDEYIQRQVKFLSKQGTNILNSSALNEFVGVVSEMTEIYSTGKVCPYTKQNCSLEDEGLALDPDIEKIMSESENFEELKYIWHQWHENSGKKMRNDYKKYVTLINIAATENGYEDAGKMWQADYEDEPNFSDNMQQLWKKIEPLYNDLHTYVRHKLMALYKDKMDKNDPLIPAHLLGNMWAQTWVNLYERIKPFPNASDIDVTSKMLEQGYTAIKMFEMSDKFYTDLGLESNEMSYTGSKPIIEKPDDREIVCHASAWDFCDGEDFRIKQCTSINMNDFTTVHHEMGHIQYFILYKEKNLPFRNGANPGFHEAVGDLIALSVATPKHLEKIGLLQNYMDTKEDNINALFKMALERLAFMPFGLLVDLYRWNIFSGKVPESQWNQHWVNLREQYQKIRSPVPRNESDFDAGAKFHVAADSQYMNYFFAHILEFQLHKAMCIVAGKYDENDKDSELHKCDIDGSKEAGEKLRAGLSLGMSKHWKKALEVMTGEKELSTDAMLEYFAPLREFLIEENKIYEEEEKVASMLNEYNMEASVECNKLVTAEWNSITDLDDKEKEDIYITAVADNANFVKNYYEEHFRNLNYSKYHDDDIRRQLKILTNLGVNALEEADLKQFTVSIKNMEQIYNHAKICPYKKQNCNLDTEGLDLNTDITNLMSSSTDFNEMKYIWQQWHEASGKKMRNDYKMYVEMINKAAVKNNFSNAAKMWQADYEDPEFEENMNKIWLEIEPLYNELHTYVRGKLLKLYANDMDKNDELIPAHILGNMWAQSWVNIYERIKPFDGSDIDVTQRMIDKKFTELQMFETSDEFYLSLGLESNKMSYTGKSIIKEPEDKRIVCHASAWDFCDGEDFRIKQCTLVNLADFETAHHEMGHIQYYILYKNQSIPFRSGANPGFHEAVGDLIALSFSTPKHLEKIELLEDYKNTKEDQINSLLKMALKKVAFLPFGLLMDKYRWDIFGDVVQESNWNSHWEKLREKYQKIKSPVARSEEDFDAGAKFHIGANYQYMNYFFAHVLEFQLHKAMCIQAGQYNPDNPKEKPLHDCDIYGSLEAGNKLRAGLSIGLSKPWYVALELMTGETQLKADALLEYFAPLREFLQEYNESEDDEYYDDTIPIIVGSVLGAILVGGLIGYGIYYFKKRR